jgi:hypothetical protein
MATFGKGIKAVIRARGITSKMSIKKIDKGLKKIQNVVRSIQVDKSYVKAGLLGKAAKKRPVPRFELKTTEEEWGFLKAQLAVHPALLAVIASEAKKRADAYNQKPMTNVELGIIHEFGTGRIPARPFIGPAFAKNRAGYIDTLKKLVKLSVYNGKMSYDRALGIMGLRMAADMKKYVTAGPPIPPPNAPKYFQEKVEKGYWKQEKRNRSLQKKNKPIPEGPPLPPRTLVDTGRMVNSITHAVVLRSTGDERSERKGKK